MIFIRTKIKYSQKWFLNFFSKEIVFIFETMLHSEKTYTNSITTGTTVGTIAMTTITP